MAKRRSAGEGSKFFDPGTQRWIARVPNPDGGKPFEKKSKSKSVVNEWFEATKARVHQGMPVEIGKSENLADFLDRWLESRTPPNMKPRTYESYRQIVANHLKPGLGHYTLHELSRRPELIQTFLNKRREGRSGGTIINIRAVLRAALADAKAWDLIPRNPAEADFVKVRNVERREATPFQPAEAHALLESARGTRFEHLWAFLLTTGVRLSEALALRWCDVHLDASPRPWMHIKHTLEAISGQPWELASPKSKKGRRPVGLPDDAQRALRAQRDQQSFERRALGDAYLDHDFVFARPSGDPSSLSMAESDFKDVLKGAGLNTDHTPHDLRHSCVTYLRASGVPDRVIQDLIGHSNLAMVNHYTHSLDEQLVSAAEQFDTWLGPRMRSTTGSSGSPTE